MPPTAATSNGRAPAGSATTHTSMIGMFAIVATVFIGAVQVLLHWLVCKLARRPHYVQLTHKLTQDVAAVGLVYLLVKLVVAVNTEPSTQYILRDAFDMADLLLFVASVSILTQAVVVILVLHTTTTEMDGLGILWSFEVVDEIQAAKSRRSWCFMRSWYAARVKLKLVGAYFRHVYELPPLFGYSKYVRIVQEHMTSQLFDVGAGASVVLLVYFHAFFAVTGELDGPFALASSRGIDMRFFQRWNVFLCFSYLILMCAVALYALLAWSYGRLVHHAKLHALTPSSSCPPSANTTIWDAIASLATKECTMAQMGPAEALARMQHAGERLEDHIRSSARWRLWSWPKSTTTRCATAFQTEIDHVVLPIPHYRVCSAILHVLLHLNGPFFLRQQCSLHSCLVQPAKSSS
ncbi:hypothetical protein H310_03896 [Aphanomyces invadans]|uniref:Uncharacterized protein n=1 Tax=Aphanomyces invadans TaxID=157072 RepID=A0A024UEP5_9STRA|nr:hypothetical protein H310_03896 [Aphanomyces invadans]ETW04749.1 hypothetical protein H310_03896 [Aphanomyces invadans]|eukprot:XP_008866187.1 hypothetical protein H310_03896 [Aphanomyces invadans]